jgi:hypothetical protein
MCRYVEPYLKDICNRNILAQNGGAEDRLAEGRDAHIDIRRALCALR